VGACGRFSTGTHSFPPQAKKGGFLKVNKKIGLMLLTLLFLTQFAAAQEIEQIMEPLNRVYDLVKAIISVVAILAITFAGAKFMFSGDNIQAREGAKSMVGYAIVGLVIVWIAPLLVNYLTIA
jgi:hypothetical protein